MTVRLQNFVIVPDRACPHSPGNLHPFPSPSPRQSPSCFLSLWIQLLLCPSVSDVSSTWHNVLKSHPQCSVGQSLPFKAESHPIVWVEHSVLRRLSVGTGGSLTPFGCLQCCGRKHGHPGVPSLRCQYSRVYPRRWNRAHSRGIRQDG